MTEIQPAVRRGHGQVGHSTIADDLRRLAFRIEQVTRESPVAAIAQDQVRALCDYLTLRAKVMELER